MAETSPMGNNALSFSFPTHALRVEMIDGEPWFVAVDVCAALGLDNTTKALLRLDEDEQALISIQGIHSGPGNPMVNVVNESGLYSLVLGSRKPEAKKFKKWVTSEVLPAIRKTGRYEQPAAPAPAPVPPSAWLELDSVCAQLDAAQAQVQNLQARLLQSQARQLRLMGSVIGLQKSRNTRQVHDTIIRMERQGAPRTAIIAASGYTSNHVRQIIFRARERGDLPALDAAQATPAAQAALFEGA